MGKNRFDHNVPERNHKVLSADNILKVGVKARMTYRKSYNKDFILKTVFSVGFSIGMFLAAAGQGSAADGLEISRLASGTRGNVTVTETISASQSVTVLDHGGSFFELTVVAPALADVKRTSITLAYVTTAGESGTIVFSQYIFTQKAIISGGRVIGYSTKYLFGLNSISVASGKVTVSVPASSRRGALLMVDNLSFK
jgi:hypothetical protein